MTTTTNTVSPLLVPGLKKVMFQNYTAAPSLYEQIFNISSDKRAYVDWTAAVGFGTVPVKPEGLPITYDDLSVKDPKRITHKTYGKGFRATMEAKQDELYGILNRAASALGKAFRVRKEVEAFNVFNMSFLTSFLTTIDGKALCATDHPVTRDSFSASDTDLTAIPSRSSNTGTNKLATAADLDYTALEDMVTLARRTIDEEGDFMALRPQYLLISPENEWVAKELLKSDMRPDTNKNTKSAVFDLNLRPLMSPWLVDSDAWWLVAEKSDHDLQFFNRMELQITSEDDFDTGDTLIKGVTRYSVGFADWRGVWGTPGG